MSRRICVLGNSHVASLKEAWDQLAKQHTAFDLTFFAARQNQLSDLVRQNNLLVPTNERLAAALAYTSGGRDCIDLDAYDAFLFYGLGLKLPRLSSDLSIAVRQSCCHDALAGSLNASIASRVHAYTDKPIYAGHEPQWAFREIERLSAAFLGYEAAFDIMKSEARHRGILLLPQPHETLVDGWGTRHEFSHGSKRLDVGDEISNELHRPRERQHMNGAFGRLYLQHAFETFRATDTSATS